MNSDRTAIPVIMYHSIGRPIPDWKWSFLTVPVKIFEDHLKWLSKTGYQTVDLYELYAHTSGQTKLPQRSVVLTFDDGYLDNWTYAAALLSKYGFKGTVFVNPEFVDPRDIVRPTLKDMWDGKIQDSELQVRGFMSWPELQLLSRKGPLSIQSHAMTHTWYPAGPKIVDFHHPEDGYYWLDWNEYPGKKPFYLKKPGVSNVPFGTPIYEHEKSLAVKRFFPNPSVAEALVAYVRKKGCENFFEKKNWDWREQLFKEASCLEKKLDNTGYFETESCQDERYRFELSEAKKIIEEKLAKSVDFFFWPGGGYNDRSQSIALEIYKSISLKRTDRSSNRNRTGDDPRLVRRISPELMHLNGQYRYFCGRHFVCCLKKFEGAKSSSFHRKISKLSEIVRNYTMFLLEKKPVGKIGNGK